MQEKVRIRRKGDAPDVVGISVSEGPEVFRVLVTDPYHQQGRIAEVPHDDIESVDRLGPAVEVDL